MALTTSSVSITPQTGWQLVAESPNHIEIRQRNSRPWQLAVVAVAATPTDATPALTFTPVHQEDGHFFVKDTASVGDFYIRVLESGPVGETTNFGLLIDV